MVYADLHVHTTISDGTLEFEEIPAVASHAGVSVVAVTDHDRLPKQASPVMTMEGVVIIAGIELKVDAGAVDVDLLGYGVSKTQDLRSECDRLQRDRINRGEKIVRNIEEELQVDLDVTIEEGFGRPDVARSVVAHPETSYDTIESVFEDLIGEGEKCYVARDLPTFSKGLSLLREACDVVGLAHPLRYDDPRAALELVPELDAVERWYPYDTDPDSEPLERALAEYDLIQTGG
ncbi:MAG: PHP domain-containing protein, partial [Halobacteriaceae archaeon]